MNIAQILSFVKAFISQNAERIKDAEILALLDAMGPVVKKRMKKILNEDSSLV